MRRNNNAIVRDALYGGVAGIVGTVFLEQTASLLYRFERPEKKEQEEKIRKESPDVTMARRIANEWLKLNLADEDVALLGQLVHWSYGAAWGVLYGIARRRVRLIGTASGLPFGLLFFLIGDEAVNAGLKLTPPPQAYPIDAHVRGLVAHVAFAVAADGTIRALESAAEK